MFYRKVSNLRWFPDYSIPHQIRLPEMAGLQLQVLFWHAQLLRFSVQHLAPSQKIQRNIFAGREPSTCLYETVLS
jgi:hypothetical protein